VLTTTCSLPWISSACDVEDISLVIDHVLDPLAELTGVEFLAADVTGDGFADTEDISQMIDNILGNPLTNWNAPDWVFVDQNVDVVSGLGSIDFESLMSGDVNGSGY